MKVLEGIAEPEYFMQQVKKVEDGNIVAVFSVQS